jgi:threonylcarbamoyladenosine tRNA methylthiotransferase MtaB
MPEVSRVLGNGEKLAPDSFRSQERVQVADIMSVREIAAHLIDGFAERTRAYVQVQNGCDHRCTFCIIPYGRGNSRSAPAGDVVEQVRRLAGNGAPEIVLTGVDLTSWGGDLPGAPRLGNLVARILKHVPELRTLRLSSVDAIEMDDQLFELVTQNERVAPHLHLSLQHGDDLILKRMKRRHTRTQAIDLCRRIKAARAEIALGADLIAGFPTETEAHLTNTLTLIEECSLAFVHAFPFSARADTPAARMPQLDRRIVKERARRLREAGAKALQRHLDAWVGREADALVEHEGIARLSDFTTVRVKETPPLAISALHAPSPLHKAAGNTHVRLRFTHHDGAHLIGVPA